MALSFQDKIKTKATTTPSFMAKAKPVAKPSVAPTPQPSAFENVMQGKAAFPANTNGSVGENLLRYAGNIPGATYNLAKNTVAPVNPFDTENKMNIGSSFVQGAGAISDIFKNRGVRGVGDIMGGVYDTIGKKPAEFFGKLGRGLEQNVKQNVQSEGSVLGGLGVSLGQVVSKVAEIVINDPTLVPSLLYSPSKVKGTGVTSDLISNTASPVTKTVEKVTKPVVAKATTKAVDDLEQTYSDLYSGTTAGKKKLDKTVAKTEGLNNAGTTGKTPMRTLAESGIIPERAGTKLDTFEQSKGYRDTITPLREANRTALKEVGLSTAPVSLDSLEASAVNYARTPQNINSGRIQAMEHDIRKEFAILRREYPTGSIPLDVVDDIKSARWDNVFGNKGLIEADVLKKNSEYAIAKSLQKSIEDIAEKAGHKDVAQLNREIGDRLEAAKFLEELNGKTIKGGRLLKYVTTLIGSTAGTTLPGKIIGALGGNLIGELIIANNVANPVKRMLLKNLQTKDPSAYTNTINWLRTQNLDRETRLLLDKPSYIEMGGVQSKGITPEDIARNNAVQAERVQNNTLRLPAGNPNMVSGETVQLLPESTMERGVPPSPQYYGTQKQLPERAGTIQLPQSKSPTSAQTIKATTSDTNIPPTILPKAKTSSKGLGTVAPDKLTIEAKKYKTTVNIQDKNDLEYLSQILSRDSIADIKNGKMTNWRGDTYEDLARVNIVSETPKTIAQQLEGKISDVKLKSNTFYHGTSAKNAQGIMNEGFKTGGSLPESTFRGGGYGKMQNSISLAETPKEASIFSTLSRDGEIVEVKLKDNAKVVSIKGVEDANDLEDYISYLKKEKIDAVYIGGGEKELVVINPKAVVPTKSQLTDIWNKANKK